MYDPVDLKVNFAKQEEKIIDFWKREEIFEKSVKSRPASRQFVFYDGPPFATGLPHYGHFVPGTIKDIIPRYKSMKGYRVERRFGWDCHGLPVENEIRKELGISSKKDIEAYGVDNYNEKCRSIVLKYTNLWISQIERMGRWVDFSNCYKTMDPSFMESVWWVFKTLWDKGLIYEGFNILPYSPLLGCPLSNFELNLGGYKMVSDPAVTVRFRLRNKEKIYDGAEDVYILAWTTTPWTLPSNLALAVGAEIDYVLLRDLSSGDLYILSQNRLSAYYKDESEYEIIKTFKGTELEGLRYEPLFDYFKELYEKGAFFVTVAGHVTDGDGTGIVHTAPGFGEDDYNVFKSHPELPIVCPVDDSCCFTQEVPDYAGMFVKDADKSIIEKLKEEGKLVKRESITHSYPFCYRTDSPIIYRATSCYFVDVPKLKEQMIKVNLDINWIPEHIKEGRFGKWVEGAREWAISRNRFWGNPIPVWKSESGKYTEVIGSIAELEEKSGQKVEDLHKHFVDKITWTAPDGSTMRRVPDILDCWFESGSMPYAKEHYPFENKKEFEENFPADFICEGIDQTRGWFYTLFVNAVALFGKSSFKNVVVNGIVLNAEGKKMSKSLRNFSDPMELVDKFGADALRFALMSSSVVKAEDLKFSDSLVQDSIKNLILPLYNAYSFFVTYANIDGFVANTSLYESPFRATNPLDRYIISRTQKLIHDISAELDAYHIDSASQQLLSFIDDLNNWYIRQSRRRFWKSSNDSDKRDAYRTLYYVLITFVKCAAPIIPFVTESIYQNLRVPEDKGGYKHNNSVAESVHLCIFPTYERCFRDVKLEKRTELVRRCISMARKLRSEKNLRVRQPLATLFIVSRNESDLQILKDSQNLIKEEVNVKEIKFSQNETELVIYSAKANFKTLGPKLGSKMKEVASQVESLSSDEIESLIQGASLNISLSDSTSFQLGIGDILVRETEKEGLFVATENSLTVALDSNLTPDLILEGNARDLVRELQNFRKESGFNVQDYIRLKIGGGARAEEIFGKFKNYIMKETLSASIVWAAKEEYNNLTKLSLSFDIYVAAEKI